MSNKSSAIDGKENRGCLICCSKIGATTGIIQNVVVNPSEDGHQVKIFSIERKATLCFLIRILLEIPSKHLEDTYLLQQYELDGEGENNWVKTCEKCNKSIMEAKQIYEQLQDISRKFRGIQRQIVQILKDSDSVRDTYFRRNNEGGHILVDCEQKHNSTVDRDLIEKSRQFVKDNEYNSLAQLVVFEDFLLASSMKNVVKNERLEFEDDDFCEDYILMEPKFEYDILSDREDMCFASRNEEEKQLSKSDETSDDKISYRDCSGDLNPPSHILSSINVKHVVADVDDENRNLNDLDNSEKSQFKRKHDDNQESTQQKSIPKRAKRLIKTRKNGTKKFFSEKNKDIIASPPFRCEPCKKQFTSRFRLEEHNRKFHKIDLGRSKYTCPKKGCTMGFYDKSSLQSHLSTHKSEPGFKCNHCQMAFFQNKELRQHKANAHSGGLPIVPETECPLCHNFYKTVLSLRRHITRAHPGQRVRIEPNKLSCPWEGCNKIYASNVTLEEHLSRHRGDPMHKCDICEQRFYSHNSLKRHEEAKHEKGGAIICDICDRKCPTTSALLHHKQQKHNIEATKYILGEKKKGIKKNVADRNTTKAGEKTVKCPKCSKTFTSKQGVYIHIRTFHEKKFSFYCEICEKGFLCRTTLKHHKITKHDIGGDISQVPWLNPKFQCPVKGCRRKYTGSKDNFDKHMKEMHGEDTAAPQLPFICTHCGKAFGWEGKLKEHEMSHVNKETKPFQCEFCGKTFSTPSYLRIHERNIHNAPVKSVRTKRKIRKEQVETKNSEHIQQLSGNIQK